MPDHPITSISSDSPLPADDPSRALTIVTLDDANAVHIALAGGTYTILVTGGQTQGRYCLLDMLVPVGGGPPPHRHDFEEMFTLLEGSLDFTFRGQTVSVAAPSTVNVPANAPHFFKNNSGATVRMLCMCTPAGQDAYFLAVADRLAHRGAAPPTLTDAERRDRAAKVKRLSAAYRTEILA